MNTQQPERLWKYRAWNDDGHARRMIVDGEIYFATVAKLNDPFEFRWREKLPDTPAEIDLYCRDLCAVAHPNDTPAQRRIHFKRLKRELTGAAAIAKGRAMPTVARIDHGVFSASEVYDDLLMWSHYADNHKGICVGIRTDRIVGKRFKRVEYADVVPVLDVWKYAHPDADAFMNLGLTKSSHWRYEKEWRTINAPGAKAFPECVDRVIFGAQVSDKTATEVWECVKSANHKIEILFARQSPKLYGLIVRKPLELLTHDDEEWQAMLHRNAQLRKHSYPV